MKKKRIVRITDIVAASAGGVWFTFHILIACKYKTYSECSSYIY